MGEDQISPVYDDQSNEQVAVFHRNFDEAKAWQEKYQPFGGIQDEDYERGQIMSTEIAKRQSADMDTRSPDDVIGQVALIQEVMARAMQENVHYGIIPGTSKPSLWKAGAEKLCLTFRMSPQIETIMIDKEDVYYEYESVCTLKHITTGDVLAVASGSCNNWERKYKSQDPYTIKNTIRKMAEKRALVASVIMATAASDIFTQDLEDLAQTPQPQAKVNRPSSAVAKATQFANRQQTDEPEPPWQWTPKSRAPKLRTINAIYKHFGWDDATIKSQMMVFFEDVETSKDLTDTQIDTWLGEAKTWALASLAQKESPL